MNHLQGASGKTDAWHFRVSSGNNYLITLSDAVGAQKFSIRDSAGVEQFSVDSDGTVSASAMSPTALTLPTSASPSQTADGRVVWDSDDDVLTIGDGTSRKTFYPETIVVKSATESLQNNTLQNDDDFSFTVAANTDYLIDAVLRLTTGTTPDWKFAWTLANMTWDGMYPVTITIETTTTIHVSEAVTSGTAKTVTAGGAWASPVWKGTFVIHSGSTGGTLNFQWAQNTTDASNTSVLKNSYMKIRRLGAT